MQRTQTRSLEFLQPPQGMKQKEGNSRHHFTSCTPPRIAPDRPTGTKPTPIHHHDPSTPQKRPQRISGKKQPWNTPCYTHKRGYCEQSAMQSNDEVRPRVVMALFLGRIPKGWALCLSNYWPVVGEISFSKTRPYAERPCLYGHIDIETCAYVTQ